MVTMRPTFLLNASIAAAAVQLLLSAPTSAASFSAFSFVTNRTATPPSSGSLLNDPTRDIRLDSILAADGTLYSSFKVVNAAKILQNDTYTATNGITYGILNSGRGGNTVVDPLVGEGPSKPVETAADIVGSLGNLNLNSLVVTRESAPKASFEVSFARAINKVFFWERGAAQVAPLTAIAISWLKPLTTSATLPLHIRSCARTTRLQITTLSQSSVQFSAMVHLISVRLD
jgi:hypothetical protein